MTHQIALVSTTSCQSSSAAPPNWGPFREIKSKEAVPVLCPIWGFRSRLVGVAAPRLCCSPATRTAGTRTGCSTRRQVVALVHGAAGRVLPRAGCIELLHTKGQQPRESRWELQMVEYSHRNGLYFWTVSLTQHRRARLPLSRDRASEPGERQEVALVACVIGLPHLRS